MPARRRAGARRALTPHTETGAVRAALCRTTEGTVRPPRARPPAVPRPAGRRPSSCPRRAGEGLHLEPLALLDVASFIDGAIEIARRVAPAEGAPELSRLARRRAPTSSDVAGRDPPRDPARRRGRGRRLAAAGRDPPHAGAPARPSSSRSWSRSCATRTPTALLQDKLVTTRNDRYVLLLKAEHRGQIPGIVHGAPARARSLFVEPMPAVELNNDIVSLRDDERREVIRILTELTVARARRARRPGASVDDPGRARRRAGDGPHRARHGRGRARDRRTRGLGLACASARHPLLMPVAGRAAGHRPPRPRASRCRSPSRSARQRPVLVISGPNTGGKTVALKTVGLLALMAQCGLHMPAAAGSLAARVPPRLRGHRRRAVDRGQPVHVLRPPGQHRGDDARPGHPGARPARRGRRGDGPHGGRRPGRGHRRHVPRAAAPWSSPRRITGS